MPIPTAQSLVRCVYFLSPKHRTAPALSTPKSDHFVDAISSVSLFWLSTSTYLYVFHTLRRPSPHVSQSAVRGPHDLPFSVLRYHSYPVFSYVRERRADSRRFQGIGTHKAYFILNESTPTCLSKAVAWLSHYRLSRLNFFELRPRVYKLLR